MSKRFKVTLVVGSTELAALCDRLQGGERFTVTVYDENGGPVAHASSLNDKMTAIKDDAAFHRQVSPVAVETPKRRQHGRRPYDGTHAHELIIQTIKAHGKPTPREAITRALKLRGFNEGSFSGGMNRAKNLGWVTTSKFRNGEFSLTELGQSMLIRWSPGQENTNDQA